MMAEAEAHHIQAILGWVIESTTSKALEQVLKGGIRSGGSFN